MHTQQDIQPGDLAHHLAAPARVGEAVLQLFDDFGFERSDFLVQDEPHSELARELGLLGGLLRVQCRSTSEDRLYSTGRGSTWMGSILGDLEDGHFARALRRDGRPGASTSRVAVRGEAQHHGHEDFADTTPHVRTRTAAQVIPFRPRSFALQAGFSRF